MKYAFVILNHDCDHYYMDPRDYDRYSSNDVFKNSVSGLIIFENIYIAGFPLIFKLDEIFEFNHDLKIVNYIPSNDICFSKQTYSDVAKILGCENSGL